MKTIGIIGYGNMGSAIAERLKTKYEVLVFDKDKAKTKNISGINAAANITGLAKKVDVILLAVKPQDFDAVLKELKNHTDTKLVVSIAAGIETKYIENFLVNARVIRAMPNIGARIGESVTCLCKGAFANDDDLAFVKDLFSLLGKKTWIFEEEMINPATAITGSGPAYIFDFIENQNINPHNVSEETKQNIIQKLTKAAESVGFNSKDAVELAVNTINTSFSLMAIGSPQELKNQVTSKGGTTEAALAVIHKGGSWEEAAQAALKRAEELSKKG